MRQGYIDSQGNKYILTGVKAQLPRWTYAEWQAEGEPDIPWIRNDAPSGYRKVSGDDVSYDNTSSGLTATEVQSAIDEVKGSLSTVATSGSYNDLSDRPITPVAAQLRFHIETLGEDVLSVAKNMPEGIRVYANSNNPTNQPSGCSWGGYVFMKAQTKCNIIYMDSAHIAVANSISSSTTSISWHIV